MFSENSKSHCSACYSGSWDLEKHVKIYFQIFILLFILYFRYVYFRFSTVLSFRASWAGAAGFASGQVGSIFATPFLDLEGVLFEEEISIRIQKRCLYDSKRDIYQTMLVIVYAEKIIIREFRFCLCRKNNYQKKQVLSREKKYPSDGVVLYLRRKT